MNSPSWGWWNVPSALAWIMHPDYDFHIHLSSIRADTIRSVVVALALEALEDDVPASRCSLDEAKKLLVDALERSDLVAKGDLYGDPRCDITRPPDDIHDSEWHDLHFVDNPVRAVPSAGARDFRRYYRHIRLSGDDVMRLWPDKSAFTRVIAKSLRKRPYTTRGEVLAWCKRLGISQRQASLEVWPDARELAGLPRKATPGPKPY